MLFVTACLSLFALKLCKENGKKTELFYIQFSTQFLLILFCYIQSITSILFNELV